MEVLPVCLAPVSTTMGRVFTERCRRGSTARGIHICTIYDIIAYYARPQEIRLSSERTHREHRNGSIGRKQAPRKSWSQLPKMPSYAFLDVKISCEGLTDDIVFASVAKGVPMQDNNVLS